MDDPDCDPASWISWYPNYYIFKEPNREAKRQLYREYLALMYEYALERDRSGLLASLEEPMCVAVFDSNGKLIYHGRIDNWYEDFGRSRPAPTTHELEDAIGNTLNGNPTVPDHADAVGCYISDLK